MVCSCSFCLFACVCVFVCRCISVFVFVFAFRMLPCPVLFVCFRVSFFCRVCSVCSLLPNVFLLFRLCEFSYVAIFVFDCPCLLVCQRVCSVLVCMCIFACLFVEMPMISRSVCEGQLMCLIVRACVCVCVCVIVCGFMCMF